MTLGNFATKLLLDTKDGITKLRGREFPFRDGRACSSPTFHPSAVLRGGGTALAQARADFVTVKRALGARVGATMRCTRITRTRRRDRTRSVDAIGARVARAATSSCSAATSAPARPCSRRVSRSRLGVTEPVVSPTFTIVREYDGRVPFVHVDVYRLDHVQELHDLGFDELVDGDAVTVVEWGDRVSAVLPADRLDVHLDRAPATTTARCRSRRRAVVVGGTASRRSSTRVGGG